MYATKNKGIDINIVKELLSTRSYPYADTTHTRGYTPLMYAAENGRTDIVKFLLEKGADKEIVSQDNKVRKNLLEKSSLENLHKTSKSLYKTRNGYQSFQY